MQTFVLAPQTPKKYYVHNDIFRYQDEVYLDNSDTESEDQQNHDSTTVNNVEYYQQQQLPLVVQSSTTQNDNVTYVSPVPLEAALPQRERVVVEIQQVNGHQNVEPQPVQETASEVVVQVNGDDEVEEEQQQQVVEQVEPAQEPEQQQQQPEAKVEVEIVKEEVVVPVQPPQPQQPSSWAKIIIHNIPASRPLNQTSLNVTPAQPAAVIQPVAVAPQQQQPAVKAPASSSQKENRGDNKPRQEGFNNNNNGSSYNGRSNGTGSRGGNGNTRPSVQREQRMSNTYDTNVANNAGTDDSAKFSRHPDAHQVFVGNLQSDVNENELQAFFSQFGPVVDVRINKNTKQQSDRRLPNYGFIVFDSQESVENVLRNSKLGLTYKDGKGVEHRLNIEEKRARQSGGKQQGGGGGNNRSSSNGSKGGRMVDGRAKRTTGAAGGSGVGVGSGGVSNTNVQNNGRRS
jgi:Ras GTPase-activating protein-binding protein 1